MTSHPFLDLRESQSLYLTEEKGVDALRQGSNGTGLSRISPARFCRGVIDVSVRVADEEATSSDDVSAFEEQAESSTEVGSPTANAELPSYLHRGMESVLLQVEVRDTGVGIPDEAKGRIFKAFMQADTSTSRRYGEGRTLQFSLICNMLIQSRLIFCQKTSQLRGFGKRDLCRRALRLVGSMVGMDLERILPLLTLKSESIRQLDQIPFGSLRLLRLVLDF